MRHIQTFENFSKSYGQKMTQEEFQKIEFGTAVLYKGTQFTVGENNGATIVLIPVKGGSPFMVNLSQFNQGGAISESLDESVRLGKTDKLLSKMTINDFGDKWELNFIESDNELDPNSENIGKEVYITLTGKYAKDTTSDSIMIPKEQWDDFKKIVNGI